MPCSKRCARATPPRFRSATPPTLRVRRLVALAESAGVPVQRRTDAQLARAARGRPHQGVVAELAPRRKQGVEPECVGGGRNRPVRGRSPARRAPATLGDLLSSPSPLLVVLDGIEDPQNVGAIFRTADAAGADGVVQQSRRAARLDGAAAKASAGAVAHVRVATVVNIARTLEALKAKGVWIVGLAGAAPQQYDDVDLTLPTALVLGAEGKGLRRLVRARCDWLVSIPMAGQVSSLNVSVAAGIVLFEAVRQRAARPPEGAGTM